MPARRILAAGRQRARQVVNGAGASDRLGQARRFRFCIVTHYWSGVQRGYRSAWPLSECEEAFDDSDLSD